MRLSVLALGLVLSAAPLLAGCVGEDTPGTTTDGGGPGDGGGQTGANRAPVASFTVSPATGGAETQFTFDASGSSDPDGDALTYSWEIGTLAKRTGQKVNYKFGFTDATIPVVLLVKDSKGLVSTATKDVKLGTGLNEAPMAGIEASPRWVKPGETVAFDASASHDMDGDTVTVAFGWKKADAAVNVDSGDIPANGRWTYTYEEEGVFRQHCHPHPFMRHNVTVTSTAPAADKVEVVIEDFKYVPENVEVRPGTVVSYLNKDPLPHTVTLLAHEPKLVPIAASGTTGTVTFEEAGTYAVVAVVSDGKGAVSTAETKILVDPNRPDREFARTFTGTINATGFGLPVDEAPSHSFALEHPGNGTATLTFTAASGSELTLTVQPSSGGAPVEATGASPLTLPIDLAAGSWLVKVSGTQAVKVDYTIDVALTLDLQPPGDDHGGGDGHEHAH